MNELILKELELYNKIFEINTELKGIFNSNEIDHERIESLISKREKLIKSIEEIEKDLSRLWNNWKKYEPLIDKRNVKKIKEILIKNKELEKEIIKLFQEKLEQMKFKLKDFNRGNQALSGYKTAKINIPMFKSFKI